MVEARDAGSGAGALPDWAPKLTATVKPAQVDLGDPVTVTIKVRHAKGIAANLPLQLDLGPFSELGRDESTRAMGGEEGGIPDIERTFEVRVAAYELGEQTLPPIEVTALGPGGQLVTLRTPAMPIVIRSVLRNEPDPKLKKLEAPVKVFQRDWLLLYLVIAVAAVALIVVVTLLVARRVRRRREQLKPPPPPVPPDVVALRRLDELELDALVEQQRFKELYLALSEIIREYVGRRWGFDALEMTTSEIEQELVRGGVDSAIRTELSQFLVSCDLVKFAKYRPDAGTARESHGAARQLVLDTRGSVPTPASGVDAGGGGASASTREQDHGQA